MTQLVKFDGAAFHLAAVRKLYSHFYIKELVWWEGHHCQFVFVFSQSRRWILWRRRPFLWQRRWISGEDEGFFTFSLSLPKILRLRQCLHCILMSEAPTLSMCRHTNEGIPSTEHVHMLHWACADIIMRGNPLTDMTDNTEDGNTNWQCLHTLVWLVLVV